MCIIKVIFQRSKFKHKTLKIFKKGMDFDETQQGLSRALEYIQNYSGFHDKKKFYVLLCNTVERRPRIKDPYSKRLTRKKRKINDEKSTLLLNLNE